MVACHDTFDADTAATAAFAMPPRCHEAPDVIDAAMLDTLRCFTITPLPLLPLAAARLFRCRHATPLIASGYDDIRRCARYAMRQ